jgi:hypothetical protein
MFTSDTPILYRKGEKVSDQKSINDGENCLKTGLKLRLKQKINCMFSQKMRKLCENGLIFAKFHKHIDSQKIFVLAQNFAKIWYIFLQNFLQKLKIMVFVKIFAKRIVIFSKFLRYGVLI